MAEARSRLGNLGETPRSVVRVAAVTGLAAEARIARRLGFRAEAAGGDRNGIGAAIARLIVAPRGVLLSFGICGGLDPRLASGMLVLPRAVVDEAGARWPVDHVIHRALELGLRGAGLSAAMGDILGARAPATSPQQKSALFRQCGAVAIDLESQHVAHAATAAGLPFIAVRAVADAAERALPPAALVGLGRQGRVAIGPVLLSIARDPRQLPALLQLAVETRRALDVLSQAGPVLAAQFAGSGDADGDRQGGLG